MSSLQSPPRSAVVRRGAVANQEAAAAVVVSGLAFLVVAYLNVRSTALGFDFRGNPWDAARDLLHGRSLYVHGMTASYFHAHSNAYLLPPLLAMLAVPLGALPFALAFGVWTALSVGAFAVALWIVGVRSRLSFALALTSFPLLDNLILGQLSAFMALGYALVWRHRDRRHLPGLLVGLLVVLKLFAWPLLVWLAVSRRWRAATSGAAAVLVLAVASFAAVGRQGFEDFHDGLALDARLSSAHTHSLVAGVMSLGGSYSLGAAVAAAAAVALLGWGCLQARRRHDIEAFGAATVAGIYASPIVHPHYLLLVVVVLAIRESRPNWTWLLLVGLWLSTSEPAPSVASLYLALGTALVIGLSVIRPRGSLGADANRTPAPRSRLRAVFTPGTTDGAG